MQKKIRVELRNLYNPCLFTLSATAMIQLDTPTRNAFETSETSQLPKINSETSKMIEVAPVTSDISPWLAPLAYTIVGGCVIPFYFAQIKVTGQENLPTSGPVILAPTHRSRWDSLLLGYATGRWVTGRDLRFMVSVDETKGLQGWFVRRLGGFPVNTKRPSIGTLRHGVDILVRGETLVIFPEGGDLCENRKFIVNRLQPGLARLALQAESSQPHLGVKIVPIAINYSEPTVPWRCRVNIAIASPLNVASYNTGAAKRDAKQLTQDLELAIAQLSMQTQDENQRNS